MVASLLRKSPLRLEPPFAVFHALCWHTVCPGLNGGSQSLLKTQANSSSEQRTTLEPNASWVPGPAVGKEAWGSGRRFCMPNRHQLQPDFRRSLVEPSVLLSATQCGCRCTARGWMALNIRPRSLMHISCPSPLTFISSRDSHDSKAKMSVGFSHPRGLDSQHSIPSLNSMSLAICCAHGDQMAVVQTEVGSPITQRHGPIRGSLLKFKKS